MDLKDIRNRPPWEWPEGTDKMLLGILIKNQSDESDRLLATELAGDLIVINEDLVNALLSILNNKDESDVLRGTSAIALGPVLEHSYIDGFDEPDYVPISERVYKMIQETLNKLFMDNSNSKEVRRRILEASIRAPQDWHRDAVRDAYLSNDKEWKLTAVFCMCYIPGFDDWILESLNDPDPDIHYHAVCAAGNWELGAAWQHIADLIASDNTDKDLLLAAIEGIVNIRPQEASLILGDLLESDDEDIVDAVYEALSSAEALIEYEAQWDDEDNNNTIH